MDIAVNKSTKVDILIWENTDFQNKCGGLSPGHRKILLITVINLRLAHQF
jgi:hypothetical protein